MKTLPAGLDSIATGISGLDEISHGGIPKGRATLLMGEAGPGKTVLTLQALASSARTDGMAAIFVGFEVDAAQIAANAASFDWELTMNSFGEYRRKERAFTSAHGGPVTRNICLNYYA